MNRERSVEARSLGVGIQTSEPVAPPSDRLLTADELAARWQVTKAWVYNAARTGQIPTVPLGRYYRFRRSSIEAFEARVEGAGG